MCSLAVASRPRPSECIHSIMPHQYMALYIRDCESLCLSDETVKAIGPFYLVAMPGEVKDPTQGANVGTYAESGPTQFEDFRNYC